MSAPKNSIKPIQSFASFSNYTSLHLAVIRENIAEIQNLKKPKELYIPDSINQDTPLHLAIEAASLQIATIIIWQIFLQPDFATRQKALNAQDREGNTPLILAIKRGQNKIAQQLLGHQEVDLSICDESGNTAIDLCCNNDLGNYLKTNTSPSNSIANPHSNQVAKSVVVK